MLRSLLQFHWLLSFFFFFIISKIKKKNQEKKLRWKNNFRFYQTRRKLSQNFVYPRKCKPPNNTLRNLRVPLKNGAFRATLPILPPNAHKQKRGFLLNPRILSDTLSVAVSPMLKSGKFHNKFGMQLHRRVRPRVLTRSQRTEAFNRANHCKLL